jgi:fructokinase
MTFAGVELGGTKCVAILAGGPQAIVARETVPTTTPDETLGALATILSQWKTGEGCESLGIASFGPIEVNPSSATYGHMLPTTKPGWTGAEVLPVLKRAADVPALLDTDVNGAAFAEMRWGAGQGFDDFAYVTVGTGVGVGLIVNGKPTRGFGHCELGHLRVPRLSGDDWPGSCSFHSDCVEGLASGTALKARFGTDIDRVAPDDPVWEVVAFSLAQLCHSVVATAAPMRIAIGGGVIDRQPHLLERIETLLRESINGYVRLPADGPYVRAPELGSNAGPLGAIALAMMATD